jgi:hypothetical protein
VLTPALRLLAVLVTTHSALEISLVLLFGQLAMQ